ncbi:F-box domain protein [Aspergillus heteromorphus CBS 117.55]|uniref:F-box domain protein n=1 Tax=Aspergillus heteromorphus CBS 117.55 TaxID=1448321 RepID=A0A317WIA4_9EURO|nr:F-box domain protein [Aspergillus heteromorphus CBS 117.55]PWY86029.1 F-box domain protein [Aspergillus heteromorphus CBS 117.55]
MDKPRHIEDLADELISDILSFLLGSDYPSPEPSPTSPHGVPPNSNGRSAQTYGEKSDLDRFRLVCRRFRRIGTPQKFPRFVLRFSSDGFRRLEDLLDMQLACHVRYFTYMVRPFYQGSGWSHTLDGIDVDNLPVSAVHRHRLQDQKSIVDADLDLLLLRRAIAAFSSLQQIKLLRLQDEADEHLLDCIHERSLGGTARLDWEPACTRAVTNLSISLLESNCNSVRFVGPQISPKATVKLLQAPSTSLCALGARLASLDVTFHSVANLSTHMETLSSPFRDFFLAAKNLTALHLGFPANAPLDLALEQLFHRLQWKRLRTLGIQGWRLGSEEIIALIRRHRRQLRDVRLASIYLRSGRWRDVLSVLHDEMDHLEHINLREIDYTNHFDASAIANPSANGNAAGGSQTPTLAIVVQPIPDLPPHKAVLNGDYLSFAPAGSTRHSLPDATLEQLRGMTVDELGDDGVRVRYEQRRFWEAWVLSSQRSNVLRRN